MIARGDAGAAAANILIGRADHGGLGSRNRPGLARISRNFVVFRANEC